MEVIPLARVMLVRPEFSKADGAMIVTLSGIVMSVRPQQYPKVSDLMLPKPCERLTFDNRMHERNADSPILVTLLGSVIVVKLLHE